MVLWVWIDIKELLRLGENYFWPRPPCCPKCGSRIWGHGYVWRYFLEVEERVCMRRYRCPDCGCVMTLRPLGYWPRFFNDRNTIYRALEARLGNKRWAPDLKRQTGGHWLRALKEQVKKFLGLAVELLPQGFDELNGLGWVPVSRSKIGVAVPQRC